MTAPLPGPDDALPQPDDTDYAALTPGLTLDGITNAPFFAIAPTCQLCSNDYGWVGGRWLANCTCSQALAPLGDRHIGEMRDVPQEPFVFDLPAQADPSELVGYCACESHQICSGCLSGRLKHQHRSDMPANNAMVAITGAGAVAQPATPTIEITHVMVDRALECLRVKYPGVYQIMKSDDPSRSVRVVVADILRAGVGG